MLYDNMRSISHTLPSVKRTGIGKVALFNRFWKKFMTVITE
jgi:hypothetical protein